MLPHTNQCHQEHRQGGYQIFNTKAGIHTKTFKAHSLHGGSTSNAFSGGFSLIEIVKAAGWTNVKTFGEFYNKPLIDNNLGNLLLTNSLYAYRYVWYAENRCLYDICCFIAKMS